MGNRHSQQKYSFQDQFDILQNSPPNSGHYKLQNRQSRQLFIGRELTCNDESQAYEIQCIVHEKLNNLSPFVTKLIKSQSYYQQSYCSNTNRFYLLYKDIPKLLAEEIKQRQAQGRHFSVQQIDTVINRVAKGLKYLYDIYHHHGSVSSRTITWPMRPKQTVQLVDEWIIPSNGLDTKNKVLRPKDQQDMQQKNQQKSLDLYSLGLVAKEMLQTGNGSAVLSSHPNYNQLTTKIQVLTAPTNQDRSMIYSMINLKDSKASLFETNQTQINRNQHINVNSNNMTPLPMQKVSQFQHQSGSYNQPDYTGTHTAYSPLTTTHYSRYGLNSPSPAVTPVLTPTLQATNIQPSLQHTPIMHINQQKTQHIGVNPTPSPYPSTLVSPSPSMYQPNTYNSYQTQIRPQSQPPQTQPLPQTLPQPQPLPQTQRISPFDIRNKANLTNTATSANRNYSVSSNNVRFNNIGSSHTQLTKNASTGKINFNVQPSHSLTKNHTISAKPQTSALQNAPIAMPTLPHKNPMSNSAILTTNLPTSSSMMTSSSKPVVQFNTGLGSSTISHNYTTPAPQMTNSLIYPRTSESVNTVNFTTSANPMKSSLISGSIQASSNVPVLAPSLNIVANNQSISNVIASPSPSMSLSSNTVTVPTNKSMSGFNFSFGQSSSDQTFSFKSPSLGNNSSGQENLFTSPDFYNRLKEQNLTIKPVPSSSFPADPIYTPTFPQPAKSQIAHSSIPSSAIPVISSIPLSSSLQGPAQLNNNFDSVINQTQEIFNSLHKRLSLSREHKDIGTGINTGTGIGTGIGIGLGINNRVESITNSPKKQLKQQQKPQIKTQLPQLPPKPTLNINTNMNSKQQKANKKQQYNVSQFNNKIQYPIPSSNTNTVVDYLSKIDTNTNTTKYNNISINNSKDDYTSSNMNDIMKIDYSIDNYNSNKNKINTNTNTNKDINKDYNTSSYGNDNQDKYKYKNKYDYTNTNTYDYDYTTSYNTTKKYNDDYTNQDLLKALTNPIKDEPVSYSSNNDAYGYDYGYSYNVKSNTNTNNAYNKYDSGMDTDKYGNIGSIGNQYNSKYDDGMYTDGQYNNKYDTHTNTYTNTHTNTNVDVYPTTLAYTGASTSNRQQYNKNPTSPATSNIVTSSQYQQPVYTSKQYNKQYKQYKQYKNDKVDKINNNTNNNNINNTHTHDLFNRIATISTSQYSSEHQIYKQPQINIKQPYTNNNNNNNNKEYQQVQMVKEQINQQQPEHQQQQYQQEHNYATNTVPENTKTTPAKYSNKSNQPFSTIPEVSQKSASIKSDDDKDYVIQEYENGSRYQGYKSNGMRNGKGKFYYQEGSYYDGEWKNNNMHGYGKLYYSNKKLAYEGEWFIDQFHGHGKVYNDEPAPIFGNYDYTNFDTLEQKWKYYQGDLVCDSKEGMGKLVLSNQQFYEGQFRNDKVDGKGKFVTKNGQVIQGIWQDSKLIKKF